MKHRLCLAMISAAVLSSVGLAQLSTPSSRFDLTGNVSLGNAQFTGPTLSGNIRALGWQSSGTTHFNSWLGLTSHFSAGYASSSAIQLIGYTGPGKVTHYAGLAGPRITLASHSRFNPYVEALGGTDFATTKFTSNGAIVTGRELQSAYAFGGGAQLHLSRRVGLNVDAHYFDTNHSLALLGWLPSHIQISAGLVFRLSNLRDRRIIVDKHPAPEPSPTTDTNTASTEPAVVITPSSTEPAIVTPASEAPVSTMLVAPPPTVQPTPRPEPAVRASTESQIFQKQPVVGAVVISEPPAALASVVAPPPAPVMAAAPVPAAVPSRARVAPAPVVARAPAPAVAQFQPSVVNPAAVLNQSHAAQVQASAQAPAPLPQPAPVVRSTAASAPVVSSASTRPAPAVQTQPQQQPAAAPFSLGEYARKLREKKQHQSSSEW